MATQPDSESLNTQEQIARIAKTQIEVFKALAETRKLLTETQQLPRSLTFQALLAAAALIGAGAALAKLFFP